MSPDILRAKPERCGHPNGKEKKWPQDFPKASPTMPISTVQSKLALSILVLIRNILRFQN